MPPPLPQPKPANPPPPRRTGPLLGLIIVGVLICAGFAWLTVGRKYFQPPLATRSDPTGEARRVEIVAALTSQSSDLKSEQADAITAALGKLGKALLSNDASGTKYVDADRMFRELERLPSAPKLDTSVRNQSIKGLKHGISQWFGSAGSMPGWDTVQVRSIQPVPDVPGDMVVYAKVRDSHVSMSMRFWMHKTDAWKVYDLEDLDVGARITSLMGPLLLASHAGSGSDKLLARMSNLRDAMTYARRGEADQVLKSAASIEDDDLSPELMALCHSIRASAHLQLGDAQAALADLSKAEKISPDSPIMMLCKAEALLSTHAYEEAIRYADKYQRNLGPTGLANAKRANALLGLKRPTEALATLKEALTEEPTSGEALVSLLAVDLPEARTLYRDWVKQNDLEPTVVQALLNTLDQRPDYDGMEATLEGQQHVIKDTTTQRFFTAALKQARGDPAGAAEGFLADLGTKDPYFSGAILSRYLGAMAVSGKVIEGYRRSGRLKEAFDHYTTAVALTPQTRTALIDLHLSNFPGDPNGWARRGDDLTDARDFVGAAKAYDTAIRNTVDLKPTDPIHASRAYAHYGAGNGLKLFATFPTDVERFRQLARLHTNDRNIAGLEQLIQMHRNALPNSAALVQWDAELAMARGQYTAAIKLYASAPETATDAYRKVDTLVRANLRLKQIDRAREAVGKPDEADPVHLLLIAATQGDVSAAVAAIEIALDEGVPTASIIDDPDLVAPLATPAMAPALKRLRDKTPPLTGPTTVPNAVLP